jgi:hypothetical protein
MGNLPRGEDARSPSPPTFFVGSVPRVCSRKRRLVSPLCAEVQESGSLSMWGLSVLGGRVLRGIFCCMFAVLLSSSASRESRTPSGFKKRGANTPLQRHGCMGGAKLLRPRRRSHLATVLLARAARHFLFDFASHTVRGIFESQTIMGYFLHHSRVPCRESYPVCHPLAADESCLPPKMLSSDDACLFVELATVSTAAPLRAPSVVRARSALRSDEYSV